MIKVQINTCQLDMDAGEMFLNFPLHSKARVHSGVNLTNFKDLGLDENDRRLRFSRL